MYSGDWMLCVGSCTIRDATRQCVRAGDEWYMRRGLASGWLGGCCGGCCGGWVFGVKAPPPTGGCHLCVRQSPQAVSCGVQATGCGGIGESCCSTNSSYLICFLGLALLRRQGLLQADGCGCIVCGCLFHDNVDAAANKCNLLCNHDAACCCSCLRLATLRRQGWGQAGDCGCIGARCGCRVHDVLATAANHCNLL